MITKLARNPKFDIPYHTTFAFEYDTLEEYSELLRRLATFSGIVRLDSSLRDGKYLGTFTVDRYIVPKDFEFQLTQKNFNYEN